MAISRKITITTVSIVAIIIILIILIIVVSPVVLVMWDNYDARSAGRRAEISTTTFRMSNLGYAIRSFTINKSSLRGEKIDDVLRALAKDGRNLIPGNDVDGVLSGLDAWGTKMRLEYRATENEQCVIIYSNGPNCVDERGLGDDLTYESWMPPEQQSKD